MSASREKKTRQDLVSQGYVDPKTAREAKERAEAKRSRIIYTLIAAAFVLVAAALLVYKSGIIERSSTALTIDGEKFTPAQVDYYYYNAYNSVANSSYASYYGIDTSASLKSQKLNDMAKMMLGVSDEEITWDAFLRGIAEDSLKLSYLSSKAAKADGTVDEAEVRTAVDATMDSIAAYAKQAGYSTASYVKMIFGTNMTVSALKEMLTMEQTATLYRQAYQASLDYDAAQMEEAYKADTNSYDVADYERIYFTGTAPTKDADGNTVTPTDVETAAAKEAAAANAAAAQERYEAGEALKDIAEDYDNASYYESTAEQYAGTDMSKWLFEAGRTDGESTLITSDPNINLVVFRSRGRQEYNTVDIRHCLISVDASGLDQTAETYEDDLAKLKADAKAKAEELLAQWQAGEATEESFAAMADANSADSPEGGLYQQVYQGQMVDSFNDWCFDASRKSGDTGIVETTYGFHIMYFVSTDLPYWQVQVRNTLLNQDMTTWNENLVADVVVTEGAGIKYVGR